MVYLDNKALYVEIIISKGRGILTARAKEMLATLADRTIRKMKYQNEDDRDDCKQAGLLDMFSNWSNFNEEKSENAFAYFTEIFKRGIAKGFNELHMRKGDKDRSCRIISIESSNDGGGLYSI